MQLIDALAAGIRGAENGTAELFARGTSTAIGHFLDFEGTSPVAAGGVIDLDASGSAVVYTSQMAKVVVRSSGGVVVRTFVAGNSAASEEVISSAFTGADYEDSSLALSRPRTAQYLYNLWKVTNGSVDWKVLVNGQSLTIPEAIATATDCYNVKNSAFGGGAAGDGTTNDFAAILAAVDAAAAAGGGTVCFPPGNYLITSRLEVPEGVSLYGVAGSGTTTITLGLSSGSQGIYFVGDSTNPQPQVMEGFTVNNSSSIGVTTIPLVDWKDADLTIRDCVFNRALTSTASRLVGNQDTATTKFWVKLVDCWFYMAPGASPTRAGVHTDANTVAKTEIDLERCRFVYPSTINGGHGVGCRGARVSGCTFDLSAVTTTTSVAHTCINGTYGGIVSNCDFIEPVGGGADVRCMSMTSVTSDDLLVESGNRFGSGENVLDFMAYAVAATSATLLTRLARYLTVTGDNNSAIVIDLQNYAHVQHIRTDAGTQTITFRRGPLGTRGMLSITNEHSAALLFYWGGNNFQNTRVLEQVLPGATRHFEFEFYLDGFTAKARQIRDNCCCEIAELEFEVTGLSAASHNYDIDVNTQLANLVSGLTGTLSCEVEVFTLMSNGDMDQGRHSFSMEFVAGALTALHSSLDHFDHTVSTDAITGKSVSGGNLRIQVSRTDGASNLSSFDLTLCVRKANLA